MSKMITVAEMSDEIRGGQRPQMIDVRTATEFASGHIPCAINIPMDQFEARRKDLRLEDGMVLICQGGTRAQIVAGWLGADAKVRVLDGGTAAWIKGGLEVVTSVKTRWSLERQVRLTAGLIVLCSSVMVIAGYHAFAGLTAFVGAGLTFAGATDVCPMGILLGKMPWNQARALESGAATQNPCCR
jgi:rhodanese-related sulfurtransferase